MEKKRPTEVRIGNVKAVIFENETKYGVTHSVSFEKIYKKDDKWESTPSFRKEDLLLLCKLSNSVHSKLYS